MKKLLIFVCLLMFATWQLSAQSATVRVRLGKAAAPATTREQVLSDPKVYIDGTKMDVVSFTFGIARSDDSYIGPFNVKGAALTPEIIKILTDMTDPQGRLFVENIKAIGEDQQVRTMTPVIVNMVVLKK